MTPRTTHTPFMSNQPPSDDAMQRALEIHRRLSKEYNLDFLNLREDIAARAEQEEAAREADADEPPAPGK